VKRARKRASSVAVIDIGSNSVRLVVYETMARSLITIFNEKALCGLGREVQSTGLLAADAVEQALAALKRYRALCTTMGVKKVLAIATAACRDAKNGDDGGCPALADAAEIIRDGYVADEGGEQAGDNAPNHDEDEKYDADGRNG